MINILQRSITTLVLISIIYLALINNLFLFFFLVIINFIVLLELYNLLKKNLFLNIKFITYIYLLSISYLCTVMTQLYFFITFDIEKKLFFIFLLSICISTDLGGFIFGKLFKGKKLTKISPKKTYSGLIGSYILSIGIFAYFYYQFGYSLYFVILTILISSISQLGDLFFSYLKRKANLKDTGKLLPGHGGILDRIDGIIFAVPIGINLTFLF